MYKSNNLFIPLNPFAIWNSQIYAQRLFQYLPEDRTIRGLLLILPPNLFLHHFPRHLYLIGRNCLKEKKKNPLTANGSLSAQIWQACLPEVTNPQHSQAWKKDLNNYINFTLLHKSVHPWTPYTCKYMWTLNMIIVTNFEQKHFLDS